MCGMADYLVCHRGKPPLLVFDLPYIENPTSNFLAILSFIIQLTIVDCEICVYLRIVLFHCFSASALSVKYTSTHLGKAASLVHSFQSCRCLLTARGSSTASGFLYVFPLNENSEIGF